MGCRKLGLLEAPVWEEAQGLVPTPGASEGAGQAVGCFTFWAFIAISATRKGQGGYKCPGAFYKLTLTTVQLSTQRSHRQGDWIIGQNNHI